MDLKVTKGNVNGETKERMSEKNIESVMCINIQGMDKRWNEDLERGNGIQKKAMRKWNE